MKIKKIVVAIIGILLCILILYSARGFFKNPTNTFLIEKGEIRQEETEVGYVLREEVVVKGENYKNGIVQIKGEGDKVAKDEAIFRYYSNGENKLIEQIAELDQKIDEAMNSESQRLNNDIKSLESQIEENLELVYEINNLQKVEEYKKNMNTAITKKAKIAGELSPAGSKLKKLIEERSALENELNSGTEYLTAPMSGIVSYKVDGLEEVFTTKDFSYLSKKFLEDLKLKNSEVIVGNNESGKVVNNYKCFVAFLSSSENAKNAKIGDTIKLRLPSNTEVKAEVIYTIQENSEETICVVELEKGIEELLKYRKLSIEVIWWSDTGLKVPNAAIQYEEKTLTDGTTQKVGYIYRKRAGYNEKVYVKVIRQNEKYAIIENYERTELAELTDTEKEISSRRDISLYDEITVKQ